MLSLSPKAVMAADPYDGRNYWDRITTFLRRVVDEDEEIDLKIWLEVLPLTLERMWLLRGIPEFGAVLFDVSDGIPNTLKSALLEAHMSGNHVRAVRYLQRGYHESGRDVQLEIHRKIQEWVDATTN
jgi:hypothetical protein